MNHHTDRNNRQYRTVKEDRMGIQMVHFVVAVVVILAICLCPTFAGVDHHGYDRAPRDDSGVKIAIADTDAQSDSKAVHGMASSASSTKGSAAFVSKGHYRSARAVEVAVADTDAKSDSNAKHGAASSSSSTKGNAAFVTKHHDKHHRSARSLGTVKVALADTQSESDSKAKEGMAHSSSSTKGNAAFVSKTHRRRSVKAVEEIAVADTDGQVDDSTAFPLDEPKKAPQHYVKLVNHKEVHPVPLKEDKAEHVKDENDRSIENSYIDLDLIKKSIRKLANFNVSL